MNIVFLYLAIGLLLSSIITTEMDRSRSSELGWVGVCMVVLFWPFIVVMCFYLVWKCRFKGAC